MFAVFDLDDTLSAADHRQHLIQGKNPDWDAFYLASVRDAPIHPIINVMRALHSSGARIEVWTGRSDLVRVQTSTWMVSHGVPLAYMLMRPHGDHRPDDELKRNWLYEADRFPDIVFEDRQRVVDMWRAHGVQCCQVAPGDF